MSVSCSIPSRHARERSKDTARAGLGPTSVLQSGSRSHHGAAVGLESAAREYLGKNDAQACCRAVMQKHGPSLHHSEKSCSLQLPGRSALESAARNLCFCFCVLFRCRFRDCVCMCLLRRRVSFSFLLFCVSLVFVSVSLFTCAVVFAFACVLG